MRFLRRNAYFIRFEPREDYLYAYVRGDGTDVDVCRRYLTEVAQECAAHGLKKALVDSDLNGQISIPTMYHLVAELPEMGYRKIKLALAERHPDRHVKNMFKQTTAANRGLTIGVFLNEEDAEGWLLSRGE